jgi:hypothetical protein
MTTTQVEYVSFKAIGAVREYHLRVRRGTDVHDFTVAIPNEAFLSGRVRYQDAPDVCFLKLQRELAAGEDGAFPARALKMTDQELEEYKVAHTPKNTRRGS